MSVRDRLSALSRAELVGLAALITVTLGGVSLWYVRSLPNAVQVRAIAPSPVASVSASPSADAAVLLVDVAGWVRHPGVYEFGEGDRVIDALEAAGGARPGAALDALNLAAPLADGTQILLSKEQAASASVPDPSSAGGLPGKININTATTTELDALPGVGEVIAQRIVDYRTANGPFQSVDDLLNVSGIGEVTLEDMRDLVNV